MKIIIGLGRRTKIYRSSNPHTFHTYRQTFSSPSHVSSIIYQVRVFYIQHFSFFHHQPFEALSQYDLSIISFLDVVEKSFSFHLIFVAVQFTAEQFAYTFNHFLPSDFKGFVASTNCSEPYLPVSIPFLNVSSLKSRHLRALLILEIFPFCLPAPANRPVPSIIFCPISPPLIEMAAPFPRSNFKKKEMLD